MLGWAVDSVEDTGTAKVKFVTKSLVQICDVTLPRTAG